MHYIGRMELPLFAIAMLAMPASAQERPNAALPETAACPDVIANVATCYTAKHETGAYLFAVMPKNWNGNLVVFAHGGPYVVPPNEATEKNNLGRNPAAVRLGFAWVASTYRMEGYGVAMATADVDIARKFFAERIATPRRTILHGASYGGLVGAKLIDTYANSGATP